MSYYDYFISTKRTSRYQRIVEISSNGILKIIKKHGFGGNSQNILEIGLGQGDMLRRFRSIKGIRTYGMDLNSSICVALNSTPSTCIRASLPNIPFCDQSLNWIYLSHVIEHLGNYHVALQFLESARQALLPGGKLAILFPDYLSWKGDFEDVDYSHDLPMTLRRIQTLARDAGLSVEAAYDYAGAWFGWRGRLFGLLGKCIPFELFFALVGSKTHHMRKARFVFHRNWLVILNKPEI